MFHGPKIHVDVVSASGFETYELRVRPSREEPLVKLVVARAVVVVDDGAKKLRGALTRQDVNRLRFRKSSVCVCLYLRIIVTGIQTTTAPCGPWARARRAWRSRRPQRRRPKGA